MSLRKVKLVEGEYYHIYNRGNSKQIIFHNDHDYQYFIKLLYLSNSTNNFKIQNITGDKLSFDRGQNIISLGAYCLMPNHFHLLITSKIENGISKFMQKLTTGYSMYFNKKYKRSGVLFEGKFKSQHAGDDIYLKYLFSYIHLNPIKLIQSDWKEVGITNKLQALNFLENYRYSSYLNYIDINRIENVLIQKKDFPNYFFQKDQIRKDIFEWLSYRQDL
ncbi:MAG: transposase [Candidatus Paceibacterota bacterium]|jgi:putative transposase